MSEDRFRAVAEARFEQAGHVARRDGALKNVSLGPGGEEIILLRVAPDQDRHLDEPALPKRLEWVERGSTTPS